MSSPLLDAPGAIGDEVPAHYGDPLGEQRNLAEDRAVVDCSHFGVLRLGGQDRLIWLDSITSQVFQGVIPGQTREGLILDPNGHIEHRFLLSDDGEHSWLLVEPGRLPALQEWLVSMRFRMQVAIDDVSAELAVLAGQTTGFLGKTPIRATWVDPWPGVIEGGASYSGEEHPADSYRMSFLAIDRSELSVGLSNLWAGFDALQAIMVRAGRPTMADVDEKTLPHELDLLRTAVHLNKGCYRGQETVAKVHNLGHPPRRAVVLHLDGAEPELPAPGSDVRLGDKVVGRVTRLARHYEWGPIALAVIKRTVDPEAELSVQGDGFIAHASQELLVLPDAGATRRETLARRRMGTY